MITKKLVFAIFFALMSFAVSYTVKAQDVPNDDDANKPMIDSIEYQENLLDSNAAYKSQFDSLSKDGDWQTVNKSDFVKDISENTGEDLSSNYPATTEVIYVWRPHCYTPEWNPYNDGQWIFTCDGWIWVSNYSWGWGPYNYGRWYCSNNYGWVWMPGRVWACNWVTWRHHNNYCGWYPTCPRIFWRGGYRNQIYTNHVFAYNPHNWVFVKKHDFTQPINTSVVIKGDQNVNILKNSQKTKTLVYTDPNSPKIKYKGPDVNEISKETGTKISPKVIEAVNTKGKQIVTNDKVSTYRKNGSPTLSDNNTTKKEPVTKNTKQKKNTAPIDDGYNGTKQSSNGNNNGNTGTKNPPPVKNNPPQTKDNNPPPTKDNNPPPVKNDPPQTKDNNPPPVKNNPPEKKDDPPSDKKDGSKMSSRNGSGNVGSSNNGSTNDSNVKSSRTHGRRNKGSKQNGSGSHGSKRSGSKGNGSKGNGSKHSNKNR